MAEHTRGSGGTSTQSRIDSAIAEIVQMNPRKVSATVELPTAPGAPRATITLEWSRDDPNLPLGELLKRIAAYSKEVGGPG